MARLRRPPYTKPIPPGAEIITHKGKPHARFIDGGRPVMAPLTKKGDRIRLLSKKWYGEYRDADNTLRCVPLSTDKTAAQQMLGDLVRKVELKRANITDPFEEHRKRPLAEHLADWEAAMRADGATPKHVRQTVACARRVLDACRFIFPADLSASRIQEYLAGLRDVRHALPPLDPGKESYRRAELARVLGVSPSAVPPLVRRHRLEASGNGKARRYPRATAEALWALRTRGRSIKTSNLYLDALKSFCNWLVRDRRMPDNPLAHLSGGNVKMDRRHDRQTLSEPQLAAILRAAGESPKAFRDLTGCDRCMIYLVAMTTGFRADEVASLAPESFTLDDMPPSIILPARVTKNRKGATQPIPPEVAEELRAYLSGRPAGEPLWPGTWADHAAEMLRIDLETAGVPYVVEGPDGPLYADFHSLRHSYIALLDRSGATLKEAMQLARHSDPKLTAAVYGRARLHDLGETVRRLPALLTHPKAQAQAPAATGTDGESATSQVRSLRSACASGDAKRGPLMPIGQLPPSGKGEPDNAKPLSVQGVESDCGPVMAFDEAPRPCRATHQFPHAHGLSNLQVLYPLR